MKEITQIVNEKVQAMITNGDIQLTIEKGIEKAIKNAIDNQFQNYGHITKQISKAIEEGLNINISNIPFESYNEQMLVAVKGHLGALFQEVASEKFITEMDKLLAPAPKEMSIEQFIETIVGFWKTDDFQDIDDLDDYATIEIDKDGRDHYSLKMWKQKNPLAAVTYTNRAELHLFFINNKICINHRHSYNPTCFSSHEAFVFKLYAAGTIITGMDDFDKNNCDLILKDFN